MATRIIKCFKCGMHLGEIRDAKLHKKIRFICDKCANKNESENFMDDFIKGFRPK